MLSLQDFLTLGAFFLSTVASLGGLVWFISNQFSKIRGLVYEMRTVLYARIEQVEDKLCAKIEYHEKHDDQRFSAVTNDLWALRVRNAARDGSNLMPRKEQEQADRAQENQTGS